jgi:hypothetical protein
MKKRTKIWKYGLDLSCKNNVDINNWLNIETGEVSSKDPNNI